MYHDVVEEARHEASGFPDPDAALYKLSPVAFEDHLRALARTVGRSPVLISELFDVADNGTTGDLPWLITFDDGGVSAYTEIAPRLEEIGWRGHFFITGAYIGKPGFVTGSQIRELRSRGHLIGAHSHSHPLRMASCGRDWILEEWKLSVEALSDILGERVSLASVPGGQYARNVASAAAEAGIETLFTSEPTVKMHSVEGCRVFGRYSIQRWMTAQTAVDLARGRVAPRLKQAVLWNAKKIIKAAGGNLYLKVRADVAGRI